MSTRPIIRISQRLPQNQRDWEEFLRDLNKSLQMSGEQLILSAASTIAERTGTDLSTVLSWLTDEGKAEDQRIMPIVSQGNVLSMQSTGPVTQEATDVSAEITVAAHSAAYGFGTLTYNGGSISGLLPNTNYYVYAQDPDYEGGAVTYLATTNPLTLTGDDGRYFVGAVRTTPAATTLNVIAATAANPIEFQVSSDHGWTTGNAVLVDDLPDDFGNLDGNTYTIIVTDSDKFTIGVDGTLFAPYTSGGTATRVGTQSATGGNGGGGGWVNDAFSEFYPTYEY